MVVSVFPLVGSDIPCDLLASELRLASALIDKHPHWLYHLAFEGAPVALPAFRPMFFAERPDWLPRLRSLLGCKKDVHIGVRELTPDSGNVAGSTPPTAFPISPDINGNSWTLALGLGLLAAAANVPLPVWSAFSAVLDRELKPTLTLGYTDDLLSKVRICLGGDGRYDVRPLVEPYYLHPNATRIYGPRPERVLSGRVRLLITSTDTEEQMFHLRQELSAELLQGAFEELCRVPLVDLPRWVEEQTGDGLVLVQVPTMWHAARLLRLPIPPGGEQTLTATGPASCLVWAVPLNKPGVARDDAPFREMRVRLACNELERRLVNVHGIEARLGELVECALEVLPGDDGTIRRRGDDPDMVEVVGPSATPNLAGLLRDIPAHQGIIGQVIATGQTVKATSRAEFAAHNEYCRPGKTRRRLEDHFKQQACDKYKALLARIAACLAVPIKDGEAVLGVLCLERQTEGDFDPVAQYIVERLADRAAAELRALRQYEIHRRDGRMPEMMQRLGDLLGLLDQRPLSEAIGRLGNHLAEQSCNLSKGYRAAVRLLDFNEEKLSVIGLHGEWPEDFRERLFSRRDQRPNGCLTAAYMQVLGQNKSYLIEDTSRNDIHYEEIHPPAKAHLAILITRGLRQVGVLSVDFDEAHQHLCDEECQTRLEQLARVYADPIDGRRRDQLYQRLDDLLPDLNHLAWEDLL